MKFNFLVVLMTVLSLGGCGKPLENGIQQTEQEPQEEVIEVDSRSQLTEEEKQEIIDATVELINAYELDIKCLSDSSIESLCYVVKSEEDFNNIVIKIKELQEKLLNEFEYVYESEVVDVSYSDVASTSWTSSNSTAFSWETTDKSSSSTASSSFSNNSSSSSNKTETERIPLATCKYSNPVDCAIKYIKDNYNVSKWTSSDDVEAYQNTVTNDYVIYVTIKGENAFGGTVQNTFEVITDEDSEYVYSCIKQ